MEIALACHMAYGDPAVPFFILQNCRGCYDADRTLGVARRYEALFPVTVRVIDTITPGQAYHSIAAVLYSDALAPFDLIVKVDDDAFPIASGWLEASAGEGPAPRRPSFGRRLERGFRRLLVKVGLKRPRA